MLRCNVKEGDCIIVVNGSIMEISSDMVFLVKHIHEELAKNDPDSARLFKAFVGDMLPILPFIGFEDEDKEAEQAMNEARKETLKAMAELFK